MAQLSVLDRKKLEALLEMGGGYVLDFSNRTFQEFVEESVGVDIYSEKYEYGSGSKANRLRGFLKVESHSTVAKLLNDLVDYAAHVRSDADPELIESCKAITEKLDKLPSVPVASLSGASATSAAMPHSDEQRVRAFISYSWDSDSHKDWTREFGDTLASKGIEIILDQYDLRPSEDRFQFMESSVRDSDAVLCICTPEYVRKANSRSSGVGVETSLLTPQFYERMGTSKKFIPIIRATRGEASTPDYLAPLIFIDFRKDSDFMVRMDELVRHLHGQPKYQKPPVGPRPTFS